MALPKVAITKKELDNLACVGVVGVIAILVAVYKYGSVSFSEPVLSILSVARFLLMLFLTDLMALVKYCLFLAWKDPRKSVPILVRIASRWSFLPLTMRDDWIKKD